MIADDAADLVGAFVRQSPDPRVGEICCAIERGEMSRRDAAMIAVRMFLDGDVAVATNGGRPPILQKGNQ